MVIGTNSTNCQKSVVNTRNFCYSDVSGKNVRKKKQHQIQYKKKIIATKKIHAKSFKNEPWSYPKLGVLSKRLKV